MGVKWFGYRLGVGEKWGRGGVGGVGFEGGGSRRVWWCGLKWVG